MWIIEYIKSVVIMIILGKCIISILPDVKYEPYIKITIGALVIFSFFSHFDKNKINISSIRYSGVSENLIENSDEITIRESVRKYLSEDLIDTFGEDVIIDLYVSINTNDNIGRITYTSLLIDCDKETEENIIEYLANKYQLDKKQIKIEYKGAR